MNHYSRVIREQKCLFGETWVVTLFVVQVIVSQVSLECSAASVDTRDILHVCLHVLSYLSGTCPYALSKLYHKLKFHNYMFDIADIVSMSSFITS